MWYELSPAPRRGDDADRYASRSRKAADAIGLSSRPSPFNPSDWRDWLNHADGLTLVARGERRWVEVDDGRADRAIRLLADAAGASASPCEPPETALDAACWAHAFVPLTATLSRTAKDEASDGEDVRLDVPDDATIVMSVRRLGWKESKRCTDWLGDEFNRQADTSKLRAPGLGCVRVMAGSDSMGVALDAAKQGAASLNLGIVPGMSAHPDRPGLARILTGILLAGATAMLTFTAGPWGLLLLLAVIPLLYSGVRARIEQPIQRPRHWWWFARMRKADAADYKTWASGDDQDANSGNPGSHRVHAYSFQRSTLPIPAGCLMACLTPPARRRSTSADATLMPDALRNADGPLLGMDAMGEETRVWKDAMYGGIMLFGEPGGGKSNLMHGVMMWTAKHHHRGDVLVGFESKGADSVPLLRQRLHGVMVCDVCDPATPAISLLGDGTNREKAVRFADLMQRSLGLQQVGPDSRVRLRDAVLCALDGLDERERLNRACGARGMETPATWPEYAARLLCSRGAQDARELGRATLQAVDGAEEVRNAMERLHGAASNGKPAIRDADLTRMLNAPMNKMDLLSQATPLFRPDRASIPWRLLLERSGAHEDARLIVNLGPSVRADEDGAHAGLPDGTRRLIGALLFRGLRETVERSCGGWQDKGRHVRVFVDELTDVLGDDGGAVGGNGDIIEWFREKGRAYGVEPVLGTQNPMQLSDRLLASVTGFQTVGSFVLRASVTAEPVAQALDADVNLIRSLPRHMLAVRTVGGPPDLATLPVMVVKTPHFDGGDTEA